MSAENNPNWKNNRHITKNNSLLQMRKDVSNEWLSTVCITRYSLNNVLTVLSYHEFRVIKVHSRGSSDIQHKFHEYFKVSWNFTKLRKHKYNLSLITREKARDYFFITLANLSNLFAGSQTNTIFASIKKCALSIISSYYRSFVRLMVVFVCC